MTALLLSYVACSYFCMAFWLSWPCPAEAFSVPSPRYISSLAVTRRNSPGGIRLNYHDDDDEDKHCEDESPLSSSNDHPTTTTASTTTSMPSVSSSTSATLERLNVSGVSVCSEPPGFFLLLETNTGTLPLQVTSDPQDAYATTSPQALTVIQLLSGVDMAGPILPPETLAKLLVLSCESIPEPFLEEPQQQVLEYVQKSLLRVRAAAAANVEDTTTTATATPPLFSETHPWLQSKCQLPQVTLDELILTYRGRSLCGGDDDPTKKVDGGGSTSLNNKMSLSDPSQWHCQLQCNVKWIGKMSIHVSSDLIQAVSYQYDDATSMIFTCLALALRYKAPMSLQQQQQHPHPQQTQEEVENELRSHLVFTNHEDLDDYFPTRTTVSKLQQSSTRVTKNIERGFEIHKLQKALEIARKRGDVLAEAKIRAVLDEMDSFQELPVTTQEEKEGRNGKADQVDDSSFQ
jgi:hypothetical protein